MSTDRDVTRIVRSWLDEGVTVLPDRVLDTVLDQVPATRQRRPWWPTWRFATVNSLPRMAAAAAAAAALVVIVGLALLKLGPSVGPPIESPSSSAIPTPIALEQLRVPGALAAGTYAADVDYSPQVPVSFTLPAGWSLAVRDTHGVFLDGNPPNAVDPSRASLGLNFMIVTDVYKSPCDPGGGFVSPRLGASVDDLVTALTHLPGTVSGTVSDVSIDGFKGKSFDLQIVPDCTSYIGALWKVGYSEEANYSPPPGARMRLYVMQARYARIVINSWYVDESGQNAAASKAELQTIVDSVHISPAT